MLEKRINGITIHVSGEDKECCGELLSKEIEQTQKILEKLSKEQFIDVWTGTPRKKLLLHESIKEVLRVHLIEIMNNALDELNKEFTAL